jgi:uncharacterized protein YbjT (DUF2867 family)
MVSETILVVGATGRVGGELLNLLVERRKRVRAATRDPSRYGFRASVETVGFDFDRPDTFAAALEGVQKVFLVARPGDNHSDRAAVPLIDEAKKRGVRLIVNLTAIGVERDETFMLRILEKYIEASGLAYVHLRPNWFMQNFDSGPIFADIRATGAIHLPAADARVSFIDVRDIAAVACTALTDARHVGKSYTLTGAEALSHFEVAAKISVASGSTVSYVPISEGSAQAALAARGVPSDLIARWTEFFQKVRRGFCEPLSGDVEAVLGRPPILFDRYVKDYARSWK